MIRIRFFETILRNVARSLFNVISTEARVKPERSGEIPCGCLPITILLYCFRHNLSAKPTVGRFALGSPHNVAPRKKNKSTVHLCPFPLPRDLSATLEMTGRNTVTQGWRRDEGVPPYRGGVTPAKNLSYTDKIPCGRTGVSAPTCSTESKYSRSRHARGGSPPDEERPYHVLPRRASPITPHGTILGIVILSGARSAQS